MRDYLVFGWSHIVALPAAKVVKFFIFFYFFYGKKRKNKNSQQLTNTDISFVSY
jgi:uncharacterized membrane protein